MMRSYLLCQEYLHHYAHYTLECEVQVLHCEVVTPYCEVGVLLDDIDVVLATLYSCHEVGNLCQLMIMVIIRRIILRCWQCIKIWFTIICSVSSGFTPKCSLTNYFHYKLVVSSIQCASHQWHKDSNRVDPHFCCITQTFSVHITIIIVN